jgi:hypothetical protein
MEQRSRLVDHEQVDVYRRVLSIVEADGEQAAAVTAVAAE